MRGTDFENLDLLPADFSYRKLDLALAETKRPSQQLGRLIGPLVDTYDYLFLDCPPSLSVLSESMFSLADALVVPTVPTPLSLRALEQLHQHLEEKGPKDLKVLPFLSLVDRRKLMHREPQWLLKQAPFPMLKTQIPYSSLVESMGMRQQPIAAFAPSSWAGQAFTSLWKEVKRKLVAVAAERQLGRSMVSVVSSGRACARPLQGSYGGAYSSARQAPPRSINQSWEARGGSPSAGITRA